LYLTTKNLTTLAIVIGLTALLSACSSKSSGESTSSGGSTSGGSTSTSTSGGGASGASDEFSLVFRQTTQPCADCGVWFDSARLVIEHSSGSFTSEQIGSLLIKQAGNREGSFKADLSSIPANAVVNIATLKMRLNPDEGIANADNTSVVAVYGYIDGNLTFLREITARDDIKGKGYSKVNPVVPIDFTSYAQQLKLGKSQSGTPSIKFTQVQ
jgi:hypothetical protein